MIAVCRGYKGKGAAGNGSQIIHGFSRLFRKDFSKGIASAKSLEGIEAETVTFILDVKPFKSQDFCRFCEVSQRGLRIPVQSLMEGTDLFCLFRGKRRIPGPAFSIAGIRSHGNCHNLHPLFHTFFSCKVRVISLFFLTIPKNFRFC